MARPQRRAQTEILRHGARRPPPRSRPKRVGPPKRTGTADTLAEILRARYLTLPSSNSQHQAAKSLIATAGSIEPRQLTGPLIADIDEQLYRSAYSHTTKALRACALRRILRYLWEYHGAPRLDHEIRQYTGIRPRSITAEREEVDTLLEAAAPFMRLWILLCSDLAIRSGTAERIGPENYDAAQGILRFVTKRKAHLTLPVTEEIRALVETCDMRAPQSFVRQLWAKNLRKGGHPINPRSTGADRLRVLFRKLCLDHGITRKIVPHDLRRTTAVGMLEQTGDARDVQALLGHRSLASTIWYLDHDLRPVNRSILELIKRPAPRTERTA